MEGNDRWYLTIKDNIRKPILQPTLNGWSRVIGDYLTKSFFVCDLLEPKTLIFFQQFFEIYINVVRLV